MADGAEDGCRRHHPDTLPAMPGEVQGQGTPGPERVFQTVPEL
jgi:hypothetical protein